MATDKHARSIAPDIAERQERGFNLFIKNDGSDYASIWIGLLDGTLEQLTEIRRTDKRAVYHAVVWGREFLIKVDLKKPVNLDMKLWRLVRGPVHSRRMKDVHRAIKKGCTVTQEIFFVAEKTGGLLDPETYIILDYLPGYPIEDCEKPSDYFEEAAWVLAELHKYDLALGDVNTDNFLYTEDGLKVVDLSWDGYAWSGKGKDIVRTKERFGVDVPINTAGEWLAAKYTAVKYLPRDILTTIGRFFRR